LVVEKCELGHFPGPALHRLDRSRAESIGVVGNAIGGAIGGEVRRLFGPTLAVLASYRGLAESFRCPKRRISQECPRR
jgi:hypothetical protein